MDLSFDFARYTQWSAIATLTFSVLATLAFILRWGVRFRLVGVTGFFLVLTGGLFGLGLGLFERTEIPGAVRFNRVFDNGSNLVVITLPATITPSQLEATLTQAANDYFSYGRNGASSDDRLTIRARVMLHPEPNVTRPLYVGEVKRSLTNRENQTFEIQIPQTALAELQRSQNI
jgi:hypothetical protein